MIVWKLNELLKERNRTAYWLSHQTGINSNNIGRLRRGEAEMVRLSTLNAICKVLAPCTISDLMEFVPEPMEEVKNAT